VCASNESLFNSIRKISGSDRREKIAFSSNKTPFSICKEIFTQRTPRPRRDRRDKNRLLFK
jgi:hypothetical protein